MRVYLVIGGVCEYDSHEGIVAVTATVEAAKAAAQGALDRHWDYVDAIPARQGLRRIERAQLVWEGDDADGWFAAPSRVHQEYRIEPWDVEGA